MNGAPGIARAAARSAARNAVCQARNAVCHAVRTAACVAGALALAFGIAAVLLLGARNARADDAASEVDAYGQIEDPALQGRFERITHDLRCLVCQNESIADSNVELASDLRRQVREMLIAGRSDDSIFAFMTDRYGEFVRFNPPLERKTLLIWGAPFIMLLLGGFVVVRVVRQRSRMPLDDEPTAGHPEP